MSVWWRSAVFYEVYMPSFADGNKDGIGDFQGLTAKLDYFKELGVNGLWLTPFYPSPKIDNGYDISDYYNIDEDYGTMDDFEHFLTQAHKRGIKVIADLVLNHTSSAHTWFQEALSSKDHTKRDWYIWKDPVNSKEPNNWESFFGGTAWEYDQASGQYYYHAFAKEQVDLNWANREVKEALFDVMKFWLDKGIDGFRLDVINFLTVTNTFPDNPVNVKGEQIHKYDKDQEGIQHTIKEISAFIHQNYRDKFLVGEVGSDDIDVLSQYGGANKLDVVFNFNIGSIETYDVNKVFSALEKTEEVYQEEQIPTLFFGSHDMPRFISRFGKEGEEEARAKLFATFMLTAKGIPFIYYGDEIGMRNLILDNIEKMRDVQGVTAYELAKKEGKTSKEALSFANEKGRDQSRSPMQWSDSPYGGFSEVQPWIEVADSASTIHVAAQLKEEQSLFQFYKKLISIRKAYDVFTFGTYEQLNIQNGVIMFIRKWNEERFCVLLNFNEEEVSFSLQNIVLHHFLLSNHPRERLDTSEITLTPYEAIIAKVKLRT
ncbi:glycoside hydrolase family 13 protein [Alkalihalobacillus sp. 1P02AB]|uniref:glycoside hydrolase family 13 protein n=1 Tax=Alkalihalobacillus sp. 1P02AB TaxID=3132260 RepID=UPI0039A44EEE